MSSVEIINPGAKKIAIGLGIPEGTLVFSTGRLGRFKNHDWNPSNKLHGETSPLLKIKYIIEKTILYNDIRLKLDEV
nr:7840_t:CDS:2 [Entrophospora candida]